MALFIDPQAQVFLDQLAAGADAPPPADIAAQRAGFSALWRGMAPPAPDLHSVETRTVPTEGRDIACLVYTPRRADAPLPVVVFYHGGGGVMLSPEDFDATSRMLALQADCIVVAPRYRQAPEHPFPAALEDCHAVYAWLRAEAGAWGGDAARVAVVGDSFGGYLAAAVAQEAKRLNQPLPAAQVLLYPMLDMAAATPSRYDRAYFVSDEALKGVIAMQFGDNILDPRASPLRAPDLAGLPPAMIVTTDLDPLLDEGRAYANRLRAAGVPVSYFCYEGQVHGFFSFGGAMEEGNRCVAHVASYVRHALARP